MSLAQVKKEGWIEMAELGVFSLLRLCFIGSESHLYRERFLFGRSLFRTMSRKMYWAFSRCTQIDVTLTPESMCILPRAAVGQSSFAFHRETISLKTFKRQIRINMQYHTPQKHTPKRESDTSKMGLYSGYISRPFALRRVLLLLSSV